MSNPTMTETEKLRSQLASIIKELNNWNDVQSKLRQENSMLRIELNQLNTQITDLKKTCQFQEEIIAEGQTNLQHTKNLLVKLEEAIYDFLQILRPLVCERDENRAMGVLAWDALNRIYNYHRDRMVSRPLPDNCAGALAPMQNQISPENQSTKQ